MAFKVLVFIDAKSISDDSFVGEYDGVLYKTEEEAIEVANMAENDPEIDAAYVEEI